MKPAIKTSLLLDNGLAFQMHQRLVDCEEGEDNKVLSIFDFWSTLNDHGTLGCGGLL